MKKRKNRNKETETERMRLKVIIKSGIKKKVRAED